MTGPSGARESGGWSAAREDFDQIRKFSEKLYQISRIKPPAIQPTNEP